MPVLRGLFFQHWAVRDPVVTTPIAQASPLRSPALFRPVTRLANSAAFLSCTLSDKYVFLTYSYNCAQVTYATPRVASIDSYHARASISNWCGVGFVDVYCNGSLNGIRIDANLCDLQNIVLGEFPTEPVTSEAHPYPHRRDWGGGGDDPEESTQHMIERIWESLTDIQRRMDQQAPVPPVGVPPGDGETVPIAPIPPGVEEPFVAPFPPPPPVLLTEEPVMQVEKFLRLQPPTYSGGPNPDTAEHWVHEIERVFATMRCPAVDKVVLAAYQLRGFALEWWRLKMQTTFAGRTEEAITWVDANLCDLQNIGLPEDNFLSSFSLSLALFSCPLLPHYFQQL
ncbi:hypothetical protein Taro_013264 [Colocasia esculenta]|uniref:Retrotransposon gag domain-containing protein n=1 Tax=Colocasia esculenta TaxID=4460 RepID=A0A843UFF4_COLES|nr:hypothetical protein [Colocasia esculenta]